MFICPIEKREIQALSAAAVRRLPEFLRTDLACTDDGRITISARRVWLYEHPAACLRIYTDFVLLRGACIGAHGPHELHVFEAPDMNQPAVVVHLADYQNDRMFAFCVAILWATVSAHRTARRPIEFA